YPMSGQQRGFCLIVNNFDFSCSKGPKNPEGTEIDEGKLSLVFSWLGFQVEVLRDATRDQMLSSMEKLAGRDHSGMDCVACIVLSHGLKGGVYGVDGGEVQLEELTDRLNGIGCPSLRGKPKLFFIQACQGNKRDSTGVLCSDASVASESLPSMADFLIAMSTPPSYVSFRNGKEGTWFIQSLCQNLVRLVPSQKDLASILKEVIKDVSNKTDSKKRRQIPIYSTNILKLVVFPVPEGPRPSLPTSL
uniref:Uncharacterized protein n=1 Tax=Gadus morhua TaxID=8049 RepID=A0A8C4ZAQ5_GADMO